MEQNATTPENPPDRLQPNCVRVHIDREPYDSPGLTTGLALYALAAVAEHCDLFREIGGDNEDELVLRTDQNVKLTNGDHFYSQRVITIAVNTEPKEVDKRRLSFDDLVKLAGDLPPEGGNIVITIDYSNGPRENPKGRLRKGHSVLIREGMEFDVSATDRS
jgi:hypothetical protein